MRKWLAKLPPIRHPRRRLLPLDDRGPLRVMFVITSMPVGGAETLLVNLVRRMDPTYFRPELCCLKEFGPLGVELAEEIPAFTSLLFDKYDWRVLPRVTRLMHERQVDAVVTVGTGGDKMFWGRLAAWRARVPVIASALHSTGLPDRVEFLNRLLAPITDAFIAVAEPHAVYLSKREGCPARKVRVIPNGVNVDRFTPQAPNESLCRSLGLPAGAPVATIVAALRPEKNHELFLDAAALTLKMVPAARFVIVGDGPRRGELEQKAAALEINRAVHFVGTRSDIPQILSQSTCFVLSSHMEANPVSILEALSCEVPVVATRVGSVPETVQDGIDGYLVPPGDAKAMADRMAAILTQPALASRLGKAGRQLVVRDWSLERMVKGYETLLRELYEQAVARSRPTAPQSTTPASELLLPSR